MADTLKDLEAKYHESDDNVFKMQVEQDELEARINKAVEAHKSAKDIAELKEKFKKKSAEIAHKLDKQSANRKDFDNRLKELGNNQEKGNPEEGKKAKKEIKEYEEYLAKLVVKAEKKYKEEKKDILKSLGDVLSDPNGLRDILNPLAKNKSKKDEGIGFRAKASAAVSAISFAASHAGSIARLASSASFYKKEAQKMVRIADQKEPYDPNNPPFFIKLLKDPEFAEFLEAQGPKVVGLVEVVAPLLAPILLKELSKVDSIEKELKDKKKALDALPAKEAELKALVEGGITEANRKHVKTLKKEVKSLKDLQDKAKLASALKELRGKGLGDEFINQHLVPIVVETFKELLSKPQDIVDIANAGVDFVIASEDEDKKAALGRMFDKIDINRLLQNGKLSEFLRDHGASLAEVASVAMKGSSVAQAKMQEMGLDASVVSQAIMAAAPIAGEMLKSPDVAVVDKLKEAVVAAALSDLGKQKREAKSIEELAALDKAQGAQKLEIAKLLPELLLKGDTASLALSKIPEFFEKNKERMAEMLPKLMPILIKTIEEEAEKTVKLYDPSLDKEALKKIIAPPVEIIKTINPALVQKLIPVVAAIMDGVSSGISQDDLRSIYQNFKNMNSEAASAEEKEAARKAIVDSGLKVIGDPKVLAGLRSLGGFLSNPENAQDITTIASKFIVTNPALQQLGLSDSLLGSTIGFAGALANGVLVSGEDLKSIASEFLTYSDQAKDGEKRRAALEKMVDSAAVTFSNLRPSIREGLSVYLKANKDELSKLIADNAPAALQGFKEAIPGAIDLAAGSLPLVDEMAAAVLIKGHDISWLASYGAAFAGAKDSKERVDLLTDMALPAKSLVEALKPTLNKSLPKYLVAHKDAIEGLVGNIPQARPFVGLVGPGIEVVADAMPLATKAVETVLSKAPDLAAIAKAVQEYQSLEIDLSVEVLSEEKRKILEKKQDVFVNSIVGMGLTLLEDESVKGLLKDDLPTFLNSNHDRIANLAVTAMKNPDINTFNVSEGLVRDGAKFVTKFASTALSHTPELTNIGRQVHALMTSHDATERASKAVTVARSILDLKDKAGMKAILENEMPKLLATHSEEFGRTVDRFLRETKIGKALRNRGQQIVDTISKKIPEVGEIAAAYGEGKRAGLLPKALKLVFNKEVLSLGIGIVGDILKDKYQKSMVWDSTRAKDSETAVLVLTNTMEIAKSVGKDLGELLASQAHLHKAGSPIEHALRTSDFHGMKFDSSPMNFTVDVKGFNFDRATFGKCSFKGVNIIHTSFKDTVFNENVSFKDTTIDVQSLKTLVPAIEKYNKKHADNPMSLEGIKVIGNAKELEVLKKNHKIIEKLSVMPKPALKSTTPLQDHKALENITSDLKLSGLVSGGPGLNARSLPENAMGKSSRGLAND